MSDLVQIIKEKLNTKAIVKIGNLKINVTVVDVAHRYGKVRYGVTPDCGSGVSYFEKIYDVES